MAEEQLTTAPENDRPASVEPATPQVRETGLIQWLGQAGVPQPVPVPALPGTPAPSDGSPRGTAPATGQHTQTILAEHGYSASEIEALLAQGTVAGQ